MVTAQIPGINISILRQQTATQQGVPFLISGRVTAQGLPELEPGMAQIPAVASTGEEGASLGI